MPSLPDVTQLAPSAGGEERRQSSRQTNSIYANVNRTPMTATQVPTPMAPSTPNHLNVLHQPTTQTPNYADPLARASLFEVRAQQAHIHNLQQKINHMEQNFRTTINSMDQRIIEDNRATKTQLDTILSLLQHQRHSGEQDNNQPSITSTQSSAQSSGSIQHHTAHLQTQPTTHINVGDSVGNESDLSFGTAPSKSEYQQNAEDPNISTEANSDLKTILQHLSTAHQKELKLPTLAAKKQKFWH